MQLDAAPLAEAVRFAEAHETPWPRDLRAHIESGYFEPPPHNEILGPIRARGAPNGLILRHGEPIASWGDTRQVDFSFSVAKSYLSLLAGVAMADGLIGDLDEAVRRTVDDGDCDGGGFDGPHNGAITWRHLLQQTSEWSGTLFGKSDVIDHNRCLATEGRGATKGERRTLHAPGTFWEYNDVRVNRLSLALLRRFRRPLPEVFAERIMHPIGASNDWRWHGYRTSSVEIDGRVICSVAGGTHWGGGIEIHAQDQARIGRLMLQRGRWNGTQVLPEAWIAQSVTPCALNPTYGLLWWLNTRRLRYPHAPEDSVFAVGAGGNLTWIDPRNEIVAVLRWIDPAAVDGFIARVLGTPRSLRSSDALFRLQETHRCHGSPVASRAIVAIPARDEADRIGPCLFALNQQTQPPDAVVLLLNNCTDGTETIARTIAPALRYRLDIVSQDLPPSQANAGHARRQAMELAADRVGPGSVLLTTDADSVVPPDWVFRNFYALRQGADIVCGRAIIDPVEAALIPAALHADDALECRLIGLLDDLAWTLDPEPHDPPARHTEASGASLAVRTEAFHRVGGIPAIPAGEDRAFVRALWLMDAHVRHDPAIRVTVSGRIVGRAPGGMADAIRRRMVRQDEFTDDQVEPASDAFRRYGLRQRVRRARSSSVDSALARDLAISPATLTLALAHRFFGTAWAAVESASPVLQRHRVRFVDLPQEIAAAEALLDQLALPETLAAE